MLKQEWFSICNSQGAIRSPREETKFQEKKLEKLLQITSKLAFKDQLRLFETVDKMLKP